MINPSIQILIGWLACAVVMFILYIIQRRSNDATIVDAGWSFLIGALSLWYISQLAEMHARQWIVLSVALFWSWRLTYYLYKNRIFGRKQEDGRYQALRQYYGQNAQWFFLIFFQAQAALSVLFSIPIFIALRHTTPSITILDTFGVFIALLAIVGESIADSQLSAFRSDPSNSGKTCRRGLWRYSRHPNYFFEWLHWWAYVMLAFGSSVWWITLAGPLLMLLFLFRLTGISYTERQALLSRGDDYRHYQKTTSVFIPWFPKKEQS